MQKRQIFRVQEGRGSSLSPRRENWLVWSHEEDHACSKYRLEGSGSVGSMDGREGAPEDPLGAQWLAGSTHTAYRDTPAPNPHLCSLGMGLGNSDTNNETCRAVMAPDKGPEQLQGCFLPVPSTGSKHNSRGRNRTGPAPSRSNGCSRRGHLRVSQHNKTMLSRETQCQGAALPTQLVFLP